MKHLKRYLVLSFLLVQMRLLAEPPGTPPPPPSNPFGGINPPPGDIDDEDIDTENFGFPPPPFQQPPTGENAPPVTPPRLSSPPPPPPQAGQPFSPMLPSQGQPSASGQAQSKGATKLGDYLELDSSVRGLEVKNFDLPDREIKDVVTLISKWTGKNFILDQKVRGKITIIGPSQVTLQEAYQAFLSALEANGLTTVQSGKFIRIIESAEARRAPVKTYSGDYAPKDDQFITRIFQLQYINADEVQREFRDLTTRQGKLFAYEPTNSIIITDTGSNIQRIREILEAIDVKSFETSLQVLRIKNTSSKSIADMLGEIYGEEKRGAGASRSFRRSALERTRGGGIISKIIPDEQTNSLVVLANSAGFAQLKQLVARLDVKVTDTGRIHVYYCEYAKAEDLAQTLASLATGGGGTGRKGSQRPATPTQPGASTAPAGPVTAELEGGIKITSDAATNALVITANSADYKAVKRVIKKLDIPRLQVFVQTAILEVALDKKTDIGLNYGASAPGRAFAGGFVGNQTNVTAFLTGNIQEGVSLPLIAGSVRDITIGNQTFKVPNFFALLNLLTSQTNSSVLSTPQIIALDNEKAEFKVQDKIPVQSTFTALQGGSSIPAGAIQGNIERLPTGIEIKLTPHINAASRTIRLDIEQTVESTKQSSAVPKALQDSQVATTSRVTNTSVVVRDQDYIMLGGLMSDKIDEATKKVPLLGDIPILGWLFKSKSYSTVKTNLIILLHPRIIGTTVASAGLVKEHLEKRDKFIDEHSGGKDTHKEEVDKLKGKIESQSARGEGEKEFDYRSNETEEGEADDKKPSELEPDKPADKNKPARKEGLSPDKEAEFSVPENTGPDLLEVPQPQLSRESEK